MSIYDKGQPAANHQFRDNTGNHASMLNVNHIPRLDRCVRCGKRRTAATGAYKRAGFVCGMCK